MAFIFLYLDKELLVILLRMIFPLNLTLNMLLGYLFCILNYW